MKKDTHEQALEQARKSLAGMIHTELITRRSLVESLIREADKQHLDWHQKFDDERLSVEEQLELIGDALWNLNPDRGVTIVAQTATGIATGESI